MKKFYHTLAIMAVAIVTLFTTQTAKAQTILDEDEPQLTDISTIEIVNPNGSITRLRCDLDYLWNNVLTSAKYKDIILDIIAKDGKASYTDVYYAFLNAGLKEDTSWYLSEIYKLRPHYFDPFYHILINK